MAKGTSSSIAAKWAQRLAGSTQAIKDGAAAVTVAPGQAAARQAAVWAQNVAASQAKWQRNVGAVSLAEWQTAMAEKGAARVASGAATAQPKFENFMAKLLPYVQSQVAALPPRGTLDQNIARSNAFIQGMAKFQK